MTIPSALAALAGRWSGTNAVWLEPGAEPRRSDASAEITPEAEGQALCVRYQWADGGLPQSGILMLVGEAGSTRCAGAWTDSWHLAHQLMTCSGDGDSVSASVRGSYSAPPGPDWGWRIVLEANGPDACALRMFNITPDGQEMLSVEMPLNRSR